MKLKYGDPPERGECKDVGEVNVPTLFDTPMDSVLQMNELGVAPLWGSILPDRAIARHAVALLTNKYGKASVVARVKSLGTIRVGENGWAVD